MTKKNPLVFLDVSIDGDPAERMVFELFSDVAPKTAENFLALCTGEKGNSPNTGRPLHYKGSFFHRIVKGLIAQGGDFLKRDGSYGESIYGEKFPDEPISKLKHDERGLLTMVVADRDVRGSLFSITFKPLHQLDRKHLVFGKLVQGCEVLENIENVGEEDGRPSVSVKIINCGELVDEKKRKGKHKKSSRQRRKRRRKYYSSDSETSLDSETESSDSDSESSDLSSSSDDKRKKRKRSSKRDKYKRGKKKSKRHEKKYKKHGRKSKRRSKRVSDSLTDTDSQSGESVDGDADANGINENQKLQAEVIARNRLPLTDGANSVQPEKGTTTDIFEKEVEYPRENGARQSNEIDLEAKAGTAADRPDIVDDHSGKSRSRSISPKRSLSKSMSISHEKSLSPRQSVRSPSFDKTPQITSRRGRSISRSPASSTSRSPITGKKGKSISRSPVRDAKRSLSRSPVKSSRISVNRSSGRPPSRRSTSRSPIRACVRRSYSKSPVRSLSKSPQDGSPKRIRRGRGFSQRFSYARRYRTPSPDRSPVRSYRYGRNDRERYRRSPRYNRSPVRERTPVRKSPRRYRSPSPDRSPPRRSSRRLRSPPRERTPPLRYMGRKSRTRSPVSRSPSPYRAEKRTPPSRSRSPLITRSSPELQSPKRANNKGRSRSSSSASKSPRVINNKRLVSYDERSPDFDET